jgi:2-oxoisovalerate dehydrogenase E1 component
VHEDNRTAGFGQTVVSEFVGKPERFNLLYSPPILVAREDVPIGYNPIYEYAALPDVPRVLQAIRTVLE